jgi:murein DD-endopeptidase MepM/ murein hydrolase activator NlpD
VAGRAATVGRLDRAYAEPSEAEWEALLGAVADGADEDQLDRLRGRQVWLEDDEGRTYRYAHLSAIEPDLRVGQRVARGQVIARAGNSGTDDGVQGGRGGVRLHFEIWEDGAFLGDGLEPAAVRAEAAARFVGP